MLEIKHLCHPIEGFQVAVGDMIEMRQLCFELSNITEEELNKLFDFIVVFPLELSEVIDEFFSLML